MGQTRIPSAPPADQRYDSAYLFGAICPARGTGAGLAMPYADTEAMQLHLNEISRTVARGAHAVVPRPSQSIFSTRWQHRLLLDQC